MKKKKIAILCLVIILISISSAAAATLKKGAYGPDVKKIQSRLKLWGYYNGAVDSIYGSKTVEAVKKFQKTNGLIVDGMVGKQTAKAIGVSIGSGSIGGASHTSDDAYLLARAIYAEARSESYTGQVAVAAVILNRVGSPSFPNTISGVIYQRGAFSSVSDGQIKLTPNDTAIRAAKEALNGWDPCSGALYFYNKKYIENNWILSRKVITIIGRHTFAV